MCFKGAWNRVMESDASLTFRIVHTYFLLVVREKHMIILFTRHKAMAACHRVTDAILSDTSSTIYLHLHYKYHKSFLCLRC